MLVLGGCSQKSREPFRDSSVSGRNEEPAPSHLALMLLMGDNRISIAVAPNDPRCAK